MRYRRVCVRHETANTPAARSALAMSARVSSANWMQLVVSRLALSLPRSLDRRIRSLPQGAWRAAFDNSRSRDMTIARTFECLEKSAINLEVSRFQIARLLLSPPSSRRLASRFIYGKFISRSILRRGYIELRRFSLRTGAHSVF